MHNPGRRRADPHALEGFSRSGFAARVRLRFPDCAGRCRTATVAVMASADFSALKAREWRRPLLLTVASLLVFETLTGLAIYVLPFSVPNQLMVLFHTVAGVVLTLPFVWYQLRHWNAYRSIRLSHVVLTGYFAMTSALLLMLSGLVLTVQALVAARISRAWDWVHIVATFALVASVIPHVATLMVRAARIGASKAEAALVLAAASRRFGKRTLYFGIACFAPNVVATILYRAPRLVNELPKDYSYIFGPGRPFAPSLATTASGKAIDSRSLAGSASCGTANCHKQIYDEWAGSAHRYAALD